MAVKKKKKSDVKRHILLSVFHFCYESVFFSSSTEKKIDEAEEFAKVNSK